MVTQKASVPRENPMLLPKGGFRFLDPKSDLVFKKIFGQHPKLIKSFLNGILRLPEGRHIEEITYLTPEQAPRIPSMRNTLVDVKCVDNQGQIFVVEMQMAWSASFFKRFFFGASKAYVQQLDRGQSYHDLCPVVGLAILNDVFEPKDPDFYHHYRMTKSQTLDKILPEAVELIFCELPKFTPTTWTDKKMGALWLRFLKELPYMDAIPEEFQDSPELLHAIELTQEASYTREELEAYDQYLDAVRVRDTFLDDARHEGEKLGLEKGKAEGEKLGLEKGKLEIAKKLLDQGMALETVSSITGLAPEILQK